MTFVKFLPFKPSAPISVQYKCWLFILGAKAVHLLCSKEGEIYLVANGHNTTHLSYMSMSLGEVLIFFELSLLCLCHVQRSYHAHDA